MKKTLILWFIALVLYMVTLNIYGEYIVSRKIPSFLQLLATLVIVILTAGMLGIATKQFIKQLKKKK